MIQRGSFPRLTDANFRETSPATIAYNCVAWSAVDSTRWWQPGARWPIDASADDVSIGALARMFESLGNGASMNVVFRSAKGRPFAERKTTNATVIHVPVLGYQPCDGSQLEPGFEKVALYAAGMFYTHAARQLPNGRWTSKLGKAEDIEHDSPDDLAGGLYGEVVQIMRRTVLAETTAAT